MKKGTSSVFALQSTIVRITGLEWGALRTLIYDYPDKKENELDKNVNMFFLVWTMKFLGLFYVLKMSGSLQ